MSLSPQPPFSSRADQRAFTLIELLVVIAIVGILASITIPIFNSVKVKSLQLKCSANLKQWSTALLSYADDHNGRVQWSAWPSIGGNDRYYENYFRNSFASADKNATSIQLKGKGAFYTEVFRYCPSQIYYNIAAGNAPVGYAMCRPDPKESNVGDYALARANNRSQLVMMIESNGVEVINGAGDLTTVVKPLTLQDSNLRHGGLINVLFGDGHIQGYRWNELDPNANNAAQVDRLTKWFQLYSQ